MSKQHSDENNVPQTFTAPVAPCGSAGNVQADDAVGSEGAVPGAKQDEQFYPNPAIC